MNSLLYCHSCRRHSAASQVIREEEDCLSCPICGSGATEMVESDSRAESGRPRAPAVRAFHKTCLVPWLKAHNTCPVCRIELPEEELLL
eukprot:jgi/Picsp_1/4285/NSC_01794-R1_protein binding protein